MFPKLLPLYEFILIFLKFKDGIPGEKGDDGDTGDTGISGAMGPNGIPGATGGQMTKDDINAILLEIFASKTLNTLRISSPRVSRTNPRVSRTK